MLIATKSPQSAIDAAAVPRAIRACYEGRLKQDELAERSGIPQQTISRLAVGESSPKFWHLIAIEDACERPRGWILVQAGLVDLPTSVPEAVAMDPKLDDGQRRIVLDVYRGFTNP